MTPAVSETTPSPVPTFRDTQWKGRWVIVGLLFLVVWRGLSFVDREWLSQFPAWLFLLVTSVVPQVFLLFFPLLTRERNGNSPSEVPAPNRWPREFGIAVGVTLGAFLVFGAANYLVGRLSPGTSLATDFLTNLAKSSQRSIVYFLLLFSFTWAPVAEEVFFRGFLYNAFRARMPLLVAGLVQSLIFGFCHFFGVKHAWAAFGIGLVLTAVYEWRRTLITPILVHAAINLTAALATLAMMVAHANSPMMGVIGDPKDSECVIRQIAPNSAATEAGLQVGDVVQTFNSEPIHDFRHLVETIQLYRAGDAIPLTLNRSGTVLQVTVVLRRREP